MQKNTILFTILNLIFTSHLAIASTALIAVEHAEDSQASSSDALKQALDQQRDLALHNNQMELVDTLDLAAKYATWPSLVKVFKCLYVCVGNINNM